jgi:hypothetical protein
MSLYKKIILVEVGGSRHFGPGSDREIKQITLLCIIASTLYQEPSMNF